MMRLTTPPGARWLRRLTLGALVPLALACHSYRPLTSSHVAPDAKLRITFAEPRDVRLDPDGARADTLHSVWRLEGRLRAVAADTVRIDVDEAYDSRGNSLPAAGQAAIVLDSNTRVEQRTLSAGKTLATGAGVVLLLSTIAIVLLITTLVKAAN